MFDLFQNLALYIHAVISHMLTILAGCGATVILELFRRYVLRREFPNRWYFWMLTAFLCFASFQAWLDEHTSAEGRESKIQNLSSGVYVETSSKPAYTTDGHENWFPGNAPIVAGITWTRTGASIATNAIGFCMLYVRDSPSVATQRSVMTDFTKEWDEFLRKFVSA